MVLEVSPDQGRAETGRDRSWAGNLPAAPRPGGWILPTSAHGRRLGATLIASAALALGAAAPASAAPAAQHVHERVGPATPSALPRLPEAGVTGSGMRPLSLAAEVPILEDPAELAAGQAATPPATGLDLPVFLAAAAIAALLGVGLCIAAVLRV